MNISILSGSARALNNTIRVGKALELRLQQAGHTTSLVDFQLYDIPLMNQGGIDENNLTSFQQQLTNSMRHADIVLLITPEYNWSTTPEILNFLHRMSDIRFRDSFNNKVFATIGVSWNNLIQGSKEDGLVAIAQAMPDLGNNTESGSNEFRNNARYDINANAAKQVIVAVGNTINSKQVAGKVSLNTQDAPIANSQPTATSSTVLSTIPSNGEITFTAPTVSNTTNRPSQRVVRNQGNSQLPALVSADSPLTVPRYNRQPPTPIPNRGTNPDIPANIPTATSRSKLTPVPTVRTETAQLNYVQVDPNTIEFVAPQNSQSEQIVNTQETPTSRVGDTSILPVPTGNVPLGNTRNMRRVSAPQTNTTGYGNNYLSANTGASVRYRVVVEATNDREQELVKTLAPGAFSTVRQGRRVMQVGVFSDRSNADEMLRILNSSGLRTIVEPLN